MSEQLERDRKELAPRFAMLCRQLGVSEWIRFKPTKGENEGWRRSPLGGTGGSHYYMWWLSAGSGPGKTLTLEGQDIAIRSIRHHDLTDKKLTHGELDDYWEFRFAEELDDEQVLEQPWTEDQKAYIDLREDCQILIGPPGSGKTSSLWRAVEVALLESRTLSTVKNNQARALYITWSQRLAESAGHYFDVMAPGEVRVYDLSSLYAKALSQDIERLGINTSRVRFREAIEGMKKKYNLKKRALSRPDRYYDLVRAWVIGRAPWSMKRVGDNKESDEQEQLIQEELKETIQLFNALDLDHERLGSIFPELYAASQLSDLGQEVGQGEGYSFVVIDEVQDLTPLELQGALQIAQSWSSEHPRLYIAGDEGQVVRPTFFEFSELNDHLYERGYHPQNTTLASNLRCPKVIAECVVRAKVFNRLLPSKYRPSDQAVRPSSYETEALLALSYFRDSSDFLPLLETLSLNPNVYFIDLYEDEGRFEADLGNLGELKQLFNTSETVKGLEFASVCLVGTSALLRALNEEQAKLDPITFRLNVNRLRVAMSRAVEHLIFIEPFPMVSDELRGLIGGWAESSRWTESASDLSQIDLSQGTVLSLSAVKNLLAAKDLSTDERVQGFISRAERLYFDEQRAMEAFNDLYTAVELTERTQELSDDLQSVLNQLVARIALTEAFRTPTQRQLETSLLMGSMMRDAVRVVGGTPLLAVMNAAKAWTEGDDSVVNLRSLYHALESPHLHTLSWLERILNETKRRLFSDLQKIAKVTENALDQIDMLLGFMGFDELEAKPLSLSFKRDAFDSLIEFNWQDAERMWSTNISNEHEDLARDARLYEARGEWLRAAKRYEEIELFDQSFKAYREAGAIEEASRLLQSHPVASLESWSINSLELISVTSQFLQRYPLTQAERLTLHQYNSEEVLQLKIDMEVSQSRLSEQFVALNEKEEILQREQARLDQESELLKQAKDRIDAKETELKRRDRQLQKGVEEVSAHLSGVHQPLGFDGLIADFVALTETIDALPTLGSNHMYEAELRAREEELSIRAQSLSDRELGLRRQHNQLSITKERLVKIRREFENDQAQLEVRTNRLDEQIKGMTQKESSLTKQAENQAYDQSQMIERQRALSQRDHLLSERENALVLELEILTSQTDKAVRERDRAEEATRKHLLYGEELTRREERLERRTNELELRLQALEERESNLEEHSQALSGYHPAINDQSYEVEDDWVPRYTSTQIKVISAELTSIPKAIHSEPFDQYTREVGESDDTEVDIQPVDTEDKLPLPAWFESDAQPNLQVGDIIIDEIEDLAVHLVYCPEGSFLMGSNQGEPSERPVHQVNIGHPLLMGQSLVTQRLWALVMGHSPSRFVDPNRPVERVSWFESISFCNRLSALAGFRPVYKVGATGVCKINFQANGYRLPTEAEWEYTAKASQETLFAGGQRALDVAWSSRSARGESKPIMQKTPNVWGLYDMSGNVAEWCGDVATSYEHRPKVLHDPFFDADEGDRVIRGGAWSCSAYLCRVASRGSAPAYARGPDIGLRICRHLS